MYLEVEQKVETFSNSLMKIHYYSIFLIRLLVLSTTYKLLPSVVNPAGFLKLAAVSPPFDEPIAAARRPAAQNAPTEKSYSVDYNFLQMTKK